MKKLYFIFAILFIGIFISSCGNKQSDDELNVKYADENEDLYSFQAFNLKSYGIDAFIYLPDETSNIGAAVDPQVKHEQDGYQWELQVGPHFQITIEDWGDDDAFKAKLEELKNQKIYTVDFIEKEDDFAYYKTTLNVEGSKNGNKNIGVKHETYHVIAQHNIDGINYIFKTADSGAPKPITDYMAKSVKNVVPLTDEKPA